MGFSKVLASGPVGSLTVSEAAGEFKLTAQIGASLGGGQAAGVAKATGTLEFEVEGAQLALLGFEAAKAKFPNLAAVIDLAEKAVLDQLAKA